MTAPAGDWRDSVELDVPASFEYLAVVRDLVISTVARGARVSLERLENLRVAVSEAVTNSMTASSANGSLKPIRVYCTPRRQRVEVRIVDHGGGFDPVSVAELPAPEDPRRLQHESGLGLTLMRSMVDEHSIRSTSDGTEVRLVVYTSPDSSISP